MRAFEYAAPTTLLEALELLAQKPGRSALLAGGTDLIGLMKDRIASPERVVGLSGIADLRGVEHWVGRGLRLGAMLTLRELLEDTTVAREYPALRQAAEGVRSPQIRNVGTVAGDLCQRPRCWYYRSGFGLLARRGGASMVPGGDNRYHAILGNEGPAYFVCPSRLAPALAALQATVRILGPDGAREQAVESFFRAPREEGQREHDLAPEEIVLEVVLPKSPGTASASYEVRQREGLDWPLVTASVAMRVEGGLVREARVLLGHVAPIPWRARAAEQALVGRALDDEAAAAAGRAAVDGARPLSSNGYKIRLAQVAARRAVLRAAGREI